MSACSLVQTIKTMYVINWSMCVIYVGSFPAFCSQLFFWGGGAEERPILYLLDLLKIGNTELIHKIQESHYAP